MVIQVEQKQFGRIGGCCRLYRVLLSGYLCRILCVEACAVYSEMSESINKQCKLTNVLMKLIKLVLMR